MPSPSAPSIRVKRKPHGVETLASHRLCRGSLIPAQGWDRVRGLSLESRSLSLGPPELAVLSPCHSARQCQTPSSDLQDLVEGGWAAVLLSSSLAHSLPGRQGERPRPQWKGHQDGPAPTLVLPLQEL